MLLGGALPTYVVGSSINQNLNIIPPLHAIMPSVVNQMATAAVSPPGAYVTATVAVASAGGLVYYNNKDCINVSRRAVIVGR